MLCYYDYYYYLLTRTALLLRVGNFHKNVSPKFMELHNIIITYFRILPHDKINV